MSAVMSDDKPHKNKYSKEANVKETTTEKLFEKYDPDLRHLHKPFRMAKLNLVWSKAQHRVSPIFQFSFQSSINP
jgi:alpha-2-macroglobulin receptor-associated protein